MSKWMVAAKRADFQAMAEKYGISPVLARIIRNRDVVGEDEMERFLHATRKELYAPLLLKDMEKAVHILLAKLAE